MSQDRITQQDLKNALEAHKRALDSAGITFDGELHVSTGSKMNGIAYRLYRTGYVTTDGNGGTHRTSGHDNPPVGDDFLGMTAREAYDTLTTYTRVVYDVMYARHQSTVIRDTPVS